MGGNSRLSPPSLAATHSTDHATRQYVDPETSPSENSVHTLNTDSCAHAHNAFQTTHVSQTECPRTTAAENTLSPHVPPMVRSASVLCRADLWVLRHRPSLVLRTLRIWSRWRRRRPSRSGGVSASLGLLWWGRMEEGLYGGSGGGGGSWVG